MERINPLALTQIIKNASYHYNKISTDNVTLPRLRNKLKYLEVELEFVEKKWWD